MSVAHALASEPEAVCPECASTGWTAGPGFGELRRCPCRTESDQEALVLIAEATIALRYRSCSRESWRGEWPLDAEADAWPATPGTDPWALVLLGRPGVGKTHVATAVFRWLLRRSPRRRALWITAEEAREISRREIERAPDGPRILDRIYEADLLLLDDIGREKVTADALDFVRRVIHRRHRDLAPTILTANALDLEAFAVFDPAVASRLHEGTMVFAPEGADWRRQHR